MRTPFARWSIGAAAVVAGLAVVPATASAAPATPPQTAPTAHVTGTTCTVEQVEKAIAAHEPTFAHHLATHPKANAAFEHYITLTPAQQQAARTAFVAAHSHAHKRWERHHHKLEAKVTAVKATCGQF
ncbi:hypothetical protein GCM10027169_27380 [Gordonia jinhuaensis]|uniref:Hemophore-related protein, Rv0203/Rv1174c family n=1 Tax=Gordonia jinhuaensis TaxID=1517702 RepID=A0A916TAK7_9ACTN|nr:hemophore-related protein [Gordonia jinhuaensis]GGB38007.1 hypothetical protein GCM10011489_27240 [Gordonia jinhuaensis]